MHITQYKRKLSDVFQINAITVEKDYFMLTHKPFKNIKLISNSLFLNGEKSLHENDLYDIILANRDDHQFHVVKGDNGSGKSHLIRWIKEHYEQEVQDEAVIFISRMQSTLKGAIQQIINAEVIRNHETSDRLKKLIEANEHLDNKHLKNLILAHFMVAVREDNDKQEVKLRQSKRNSLYDFLASQETQELLLRANGPIDRIQKKLAPGVNNEVMNDVNPHFVPEDFRITSKRAGELKLTDLSKKALNFIAEIQDASDAEEQQEVEEFREQIAKYLNQFLDKVVQECLSLRGTDLTDIFLLLRQELKKEGKNLTLFIEDITSFTGVDKDLVEVLISDDKEDSTLCRLISIVGITNGYYNTSLPGSITDRITSHIEIDNVVIQNEDEAAELAARYINAVYVEDDQIQQWKSSGYRLDEFPVATVFKHHEWANCKIENNFELSIFPFTKAALWNFYKNLDTQTPRNFLQIVLLQYIQKYTIDGPSGNFPPPIHKVITDFKRVPNWRNSSTDRVLKNKVPAHLKEQYETLFRIWGNGTMEEQIFNGKNIVGGLEDDIFLAFGLEPVSGIKSSSTTSEAQTGRTSGDTSSVTQGPTARGKKPEEHGGTIKPKPVVSTKGSLPPVDPTVNPKPPVIDESLLNPELEEALGEIEKWSKGSPLSNTWMISDLLDIIRDYIHWDLEGISTLIVKDFLTNNYVLIEGQSKSVKVKEENALVFKRSDNLRYALEALASYKYEGKKSWDFDNSYMALLSLHTWIEMVKGDVIYFLKKPYDYDSDHWQMKEYLVSAEFYTTALLNGFIGAEELAEDIYLQLVKNKESDKTKQHSQYWSAITNYLHKGQTELFRHYFNVVQGGVKTLSRASFTLFYDAYEIITMINKLKSVDFKIQVDNIPSGRTNSWYISANISKAISERVTTTIEEEVKQSRAFVEALREIIGNEVSNEIIIKTVEEMKGFLDYLKEIMEPFQHDTYEILYKDVFDYREIADKIKVLQTLSETDSMVEQLIMMSNNPLLQVQPFYVLLDKFSKLVDEKDRLLSPKIEGLQEEISSYSKNEISAMQHELMTIKEDITNLDERSAQYVVK
ncbi:hypothetical protein [Ectobacillus funiculus]|uniref:hypothetical protein n=1 Tax=Ectobacillus funiculus TaxID=137993 RepID=UPI00101BD27B|nr:hypothetical protein [Ectobacillus funiculus]